MRLLNGADPSPEAAREAAFLRHRRNFAFRY